MSSEAISFPENLKALKVAAVAAKAEFHAHRYTGDPEDVMAQIAFDVEEARLSYVCTVARIAYDAALRAYREREAA